MTGSPTFRGAGSTGWPAPTPAPAPTVAMSRMLLGALLVRSVAAQGDCTVAALSQPENGQLGTECQPFETLAHGASCSLVCNVGYTRAGVQPSCTNSDFDTGSIVCNGDP